MTYIVHVERTVALPIDEAFAALADHNQLGDLLGGAVRRIKEGEHETNGLGSARQILKGPLAFEETVTGFVPNQEIEYKISRGSPLRNHIGRLTFESRGESSTHVTWRIEFEVVIPLLGGVIKKVLTKLVTGGLEKLDRN